MRELRHHAVARHCSLTARHRRAARVQLYAFPGRGLALRGSKRLYPPTVTAIQLSSHHAAIILKSA